MAPTKSRTAIAVVAGAAALGAGLGVTSLASADPTATPAPGTAAPSTAAPSTGTPATPNPGKGAGHFGHGGRGFDAGEADLAKTLAGKLGVSEAKVTAALKAVRQENRADRPAAPKPDGTRPDPAVRDAALAKALASKLGVSEAKVTSALTEIRTARQAERATALKTRLDAAVKAGTLTQAEADAVTKAVQKGVIGGGGGPR